MDIERKTQELRRRAAASAIVAMMTESERGEAWGHRVTVREAEPWPKASPWRWQRG